ncbi:MAG: hypothetical protein SFY32_13390 [Bacteroidota bacterium]|nr:hypothetical protein [Bacteroidota bacterium]
MGLHNLFGLVFCNSSQNNDGLDTGLKLVDDRTRLMVAADKLSRSEIPVFISIGEDQINDYNKVFNEKNIIKGISGHPFPLCSLLSAHQKYPKKDILALSCNLTQINRESIIKLLKQYSLQPSYDFFCFQNDEGLFEWSLAIYTSKTLKNLSKEIKESGNAFKFEQYLNLQKCFPIKIKKKELAFFAFSP